MFRDRRRGLRRTYQIGEFISSEEEGLVNVKPNILYRWKPSKDIMVQHSPSIRFFEELARHTGLSQSEINRDLAQKKDILNYMVKNNIRSLEEVGKILSNFYIDPDSIADMIKKRYSPLKVLKKKKV